MTNFERETVYNNLHETGGGADGLEYYLYIDVVFVVNLIMDIMVLLLLNMIFKGHASIFRIILSSSIGALWACIVVIYPVMPVVLEMILTCIGIGSLMVKVAFNPKGIRELIKGVLGLYLCAVTLGGIMYACYQYTNTGFYVEQLIRGNAVEGLPLVIFILLGAGACFSARYLWLTLLEVQRHKRNLYEVKLSHEGIAIQVKGLLDTGNHLYEPFSHKPVHVVSQAVWGRFYQEGSPVYVIPYHTIGTKDGIMRGIIIDSMEVTGEQERKVIVKPLIAAAPYPVASDGSYDILLHEDN